MDSKKFLDANGLLYFWQKIKNLFVRQETGKGLSSNDYTSADKEKLTNIASNAQVNVIETVKVNGTAQEISNKAVNITVPTTTSVLENDSNFVVDPNYNHTDNNFTNALKEKLENSEENAIETIKVNGSEQIITNKAVNISVPTNTNQLTNGAGYQTASDVENAINSKLTSAVRYKGTVASYSNLPTENNIIGDMYNVQTDDSTHGIKAGDNVVWDGSAWDIQSGTIDTSNFIEEGDLVEISNSEIDTIVAS